MTILIYNWKDVKNPLVGGAEVITFEYARRLAAEGHQVTWFCRSFENAKPEEVIDGVTVVRRGGFLSTYWEGYRYYRGLERKPDLVVDMLNTIAWQAPLYARGQSKVVQYVNQLAKEVWSYEMRPPMSWLGRLLEPVQLWSYHKQPVVTYAQSTADDLVAWGYDSKKIFQFRLGLDHSRYVPGKKADYPLLLQVCRMVRMKRPDLTVRAFAEVLKEIPQAKLALVGTGPFKPQVDALIKELGIEEQILMPDKDIWFFNKVEGDQKIKLMQQAWGFVHPSVKEGWGMVITEAAACGTPSIATAVTGQVDSVKDGETGLLISANPTVEELAAAMKRLLSDEKLRHRLSQNCLQWAAELDWDKSFQQFKEALEQASQLPIRPAESQALPKLTKLPTISIITPVYNAAGVLEEYFAGLDQTTYPKDKLRIIMPDGGSKDATRKIAEAHGAIVLENELKTGEAGKAVGVRYVLEQLRQDKQDAADHLVCMLDSDNILTQPDWFHRMVEPFQNETGIIGSEPWEYTYRSSDGYITRYTAMIGMSDPLTMYLGNYDRQNMLSGRWTDLPIRTIDHGPYLTWEINPKRVPTIGANGTMFRANFFEPLTIGDYLFDIDLLYEYTLMHSAKFAKVKIGLVHIFCRTVSDFIRKQRRRIKDFHYFHAMGLRTYPWNSINQTGLVVFVLSCVTVVPLVWQTIKGLSRRPDSAWLFHPIACWLTLWIYGTGKVFGRFQKPALADRTHWRQS